MHAQRTGQKGFPRGSHSTRSDAWLISFDVMNGSTFMLAIEMEKSMTFSKSRNPDFAPFFSAMMEEGE
jgi:hypothetical protein